MSASSTPPAARRPFAALSARPRAALRDLRREAAHRGPLWLLWQLALTSLLAGLLLALAWSLGRWILYQADWAVVSDNLRLFAVYRYPRGPAYDWRPFAALALVAGLLGASAALQGELPRELARFLGWVLGSLLGFALLGPALLGAIGADAPAALAAAFRPAAPWLAAALAALALAYAAGRAADRRLPPSGARRARVRRGLGLAWLLSIPGLLWLLHGGGPWLPHAGYDRWGGLLLTLTLAVLSIAIAFPLGVIFALGRRSPLPLVRGVSVGFIEIMRGMPLITILFMASLIVPLVLPDALNPDKLFRAVAGLALFAAAYVAEDVRGGLNAIPAGQYEAARALGLRSSGTYRLVILPQALRTVVPSLVGQFISLVKDTALVLIIPLVELVGVADQVINQPEFLGLFRESYAFIALIFFVICWSLARASRKLELDRGDRP